MIFFKDKKAGRIWCKKLRRALRNLQEMCLYIRGVPALVKTLRFGCMQQSVSRLQCEREVT